MKKYVEYIFIYLNKKQIINISYTEKFKSIYSAYFFSNKNKTKHNILNQSSIHTNRQT